MQKHFDKTQCGEKGISSLIVIIIIVVLLVAVGFFANKYLLTPGPNNPRTGAIDLKSKCCDECIKGWQPQWDSALHCVDTTKMSAECIDYLGIRGITGISTADAYAGYCMEIE